MKRWIWDIEVYRNLFLICAKNCQSGKKVNFQVSQFQDDRSLIIKWLQEEVEEMVGFNNVFYDYPVLHYALKKLWKLRGRDFCSNLFNYSSNLIEGKNKTFIKNKDIVKKQIDLYKINHFDNKAKTASLKLLEFNLKLKNIQELPYLPETELSFDQIQEVISYCHNDVLATELVYLQTLLEIQLREKLKPKYNIDFTNFNSTKIGEYILISKIIEKLGEDAVYDIVETEYGTKKSIKNTHRTKIDLNDVIFPYICFETEPFKKILEWFKLQVIQETKGVFSQIDFDNLKILEPYYVIEKKLNKQKALNVIYKGLIYYFGAGGIHACVSPGVYKSDDEFIIIDLDVSSYYPNLAIKNKFYPEHFSEIFCDIYESVYNERKEYPKKSVENIALKFALNGSYGKSNSEYSALYDPLYTMKTTVNGQLLLCMLSERLMEEIPDSQTLQMNTDGTTIRIRRKDIDNVFSICKRWENLTKLELEHVFYDKMIIKDVNNYISISNNGYVKRKGAAFIYNIAPGELELHKNFSMLVVQKCLESYFTNNIKPEEFIHNHILNDDNIYDFFKRTKIKRSDELVSRIYDSNGNIINQNNEQRITRYYISGYSEYDKKTKLYSYHGSGKVLIKLMPPLKGKDIIRETNIESGYLCTVCNNLDSISTDNIRKTINYQYYIDEVYKVINQIEKN